jgi:hypothetical protein
MPIDLPSIASNLASKPGGAVDDVASGCVSIALSAAFADISGTAPISAPQNDARNTTPQTDSNDKQLRGCVKIAERNRQATRWERLPCVVSTFESMAPMARLTASPIHT